MGFCNMCSVGRYRIIGNTNSSTETNDNITTATFELHHNPVDVNAVEPAEVIELHPRIQAYKVEGQVNSDWKLLTKAQP
jgi:hypothetical protein